MSHELSAGYLCAVQLPAACKPEEKVIHWIDSIAEDQLFISVITIGEVQSAGSNQLPMGARTELLVWMNTGLSERFARRSSLWTQRRCYYGGHSPPGWKNLASRCR